MKKGNTTDTFLNQMHGTMLTVIVHSEQAKSDFEGTVIDIETTGEFCCDYPDSDSRQYQDVIPVIFGYIDKDALHILCAKGLQDIEELKANIVQLVPRLIRPLLAFNCSFEKGVLFHSCGMVVDFDGELNKEAYEGKREAITGLGIDNYDDPFCDVGLECKRAWDRGEYELSIRHNRSCLLKERDILLRRGCRGPDELRLYDPTAQYDHNPRIHPMRTHTITVGSRLLLGPPTGNTRPDLIPLAPPPAFCWFYGKHGVKLPVRL